MKTYVLTLSKTFPKWHPRAGQATFFKDKFHAAITNNDEYWNKLHTIRANYELWRKRFEQIESGEACLSIRQWTGKPYASKQIEIARLTKEDGIGLQKLEFEKCRGSYGQPITKAIVRGTWVVNPMLAKNDGLSLDDWYTWFEDYDKTKPLAIIHFTKFRY